MSSSDNFFLMATYSICNLARIEQFLQLHPDCPLVITGTTGDVQVVGLSADLERVEGNIPDVAQAYGRPDTNSLWTLLSKLITLMAAECSLLNQVQDMDEVPKITASMRRKLELCLLVNSQIMGPVATL